MIYSPGSLSPRTISFTYLLFGLAPNLLTLFGLSLYLLGFVIFLWKKIQALLFLL
jgi:hypothetical protein